jgi:hypothetical protein
MSFRIAQLVPIRTSHIPKQGEKINMEENLKAGSD